MPAVEYGVACEKGYRCTNKDRSKRDPGERDFGSHVLRKNVPDSEQRDEFGNERREGGAIDPQSRNKSDIECNIQHESGGAHPNHSVMAIARDGRETKAGVQI